MKPEVPQGLLEQAAAWSKLSRRQRSDLGKALRRLGLTFNEIREIIPVPKSTLSHWCRDIELASEQVAAIRLRGYSQPGDPRDTQSKRRHEIELIRDAARRAAPVRSTEPLFIAGVALYWAEGSKTQSDLTLANTAPALLRLFILWIRTYLDADAEFRLSLHLHQDNDETAAKRFWRRALSLPAARFTKTYIKQAGTGHRKNHLPYGVCRVRVCRSADLWHTAMEWIEYTRDQVSPTVATLAPGR